MRPDVADATAPSANLRANGESEFFSPRVLMREAAKVVEDLHLPIRGARLRLLVERFVSSGRSDLDFRTWFISYSDPTGETAVRNVVAARGF